MDKLTRENGQLPADTSLQSITTRKRGAQPGNLNALKHGFYSRQFRSREHIDLDALLSIDLLDEIHLLRILIRRALELSNDTGDLAECLSVLKATSAASARITAMLRVQQMLGKSSDVSELISKAIAEVNQELDLARRFRRHDP
jgi:hypothetical protein